MSNVSSSNSQGVRVPKLRFPGFEGEWEEKSFSDVATGFDYGMNAAAGLYDGVNKYIRITDIDEDSRCYIDANPVSPQGNLDDKYLVHEHDILFARTGASTGKTYLYKKSDGKLYFAGFLIRATVNSHNNSIFVYNSTLTDKYNSWVRLTSMRSGQPGINSQEYSSYRTYYPHLDEQNKIATFLDVLERRIAKQRQLVELLKSYKRGALSKLFPKQGENTPECRFAGFTEPWKRRKISEICEQITDTINPLDKPDEFFTEYSMPAFDNNEMADSVMGKSMNSMRKVMNKPCLLVNKLNVRKKRIWIVEKPENNAVCSAEFVPLSSIDSNLSFVKYLMLTELFTSYLEDCSSGSSNSQKRVTPDAIMSARIIIPKFKEQQQIGTFFRYLDHLITLHQRKLNEFESVKTGLLQRLFI